MGVLGQTEISWAIIYTEFKKIRESNQEDPKMSNRLKMAQKEWLFANFQPHASKVFRWKSIFEHLKIMDLDSRICESKYDWWTIIGNKHFAFNRNHLYIYFSTYLGIFWSCWKQALSHFDDYWICAIFPFSHISINISEKV